MRIEIAQILSQIISFLVMLWVLKRFAWKPLLGILDARREKVQNDLDSIASQKQDIANLISQYNTKINEIDLYAKEKIDAEIAEGRKIAAKIQEQAHQEARNTIAKTQKDLQNEIEKAKGQLKDEIVNLAMNTTEKMLKEKIDSSKQKGYMTDFIERMGAK